MDGAVDAPASIVDGAIDGASGGITIQQVQNDAMPPGTQVSLHGVIVTAIDSYGAKTGDLWVEEAGGGAFSGVHVFGAPITTVAALALGDVVDLTGAQKAEFALASDTSGRTVTELEPVAGGAMAIAKIGIGAVAPEVVDAQAIAQLTTQAARDAEWEKWEGVLITIANVSAVGAPACVGTCTDPTLQKFFATGQVAVESALAAFPAGIAAGACLASVTGVGDYFFDYLILPRTTAEIATGGTGCPPAAHP